VQVAAEGGRPAPHSSSGDLPPVPSQRNHLGQLGIDVGWFAEALVGHLPVAAVGDGPCSEQMDAVESYIIKSAASSS
jgi:hypothetical protein